MEFEDHSTSGTAVDGKRLWHEKMTVEIKDGKIPVVMLAGRKEGLLDRDAVLFRLSMNRNQDREEETRPTRPVEAVETQTAEPWWQKGLRWIGVVAVLMVPLTAVVCCALTHKKHPRYARWVAVLGIVSALTGMVIMMIDRA